MLWSLTFVDLYVSERSLERPRCGREKEGEDENLHTPPSMVLPAILCLEVLRRQPWVAIALPRAIRKKPF